VYVAFLFALQVSFSVLLAHRATIFGYETFRFPTASMRETLLPGDYFVSNTVRYRDKEPQRGELIVLRRPGDPDSKYVKRVIGLPGETIEIDSGEVRINGTLIHEAYVAAANNRGLLAGDGKWVVPQRSFFVLGDNRDNSEDSRFWGAVPIESIHGSVEFIWLSIDADGRFRSDRFGKRLY
jgi:signal peptidase I